jgi:hypothetical protein
MASAVAARSDAGASPVASATALRVAGLAAVLAATVVAPAAMLVWMPIVLGVPHIASDIRYLLVPLPRRELVIGVVACAALVAVRAAAIATGAGLLRVEMVIVGGWLVASIAQAPARRGWSVGAAAVAAVIVLLPLAAAAIAALAHSLFAVVAWVVVARPDRRRRALVIGAVAAGAVVAFLAGPAIAGHTGGSTTAWLTLERAAATVFPGVDASVAAGLIIAFAFLQAVHYAIWLAWIPAERGRGRRTPAARLGLLAVGAGTLAVIAAAMVDPAWARTTYLGLATFHIYLELVVLAVWLARRRARS